MKSLLTLCCVVLLAVRPTRAVAPVEELLRYVPRDMTFCMVLRDLRGHLATLSKSPFAEQMRESPFGLALSAAPELQQVLKAREFFEKSLGINLDKIRDDILGDAIVFAYRQGPPGKPEQEAGLVLLRAREAKPLADLLAGLDKLVKLKEVKEVEHDGLKYQRRVEGDEVSFLHLRGPVLIFSAQEAMLKEALSLEKKTALDQESAVGQSLKQLGADKALGAIWINPRSFDNHLTNRLDKVEDGEKAFLKTFLTCWKAIDAVALTLSMDRDLSFGLTMRGRPAAMPSAVRQFLDDASGPADLWTRFPEDAMLALGARTPAGSLLAFLGSFQSKQAFESMQEELNRSLGAALGKEHIKEVFPHIGPDWGLSVSAPPRDEKPWFPSILFALRVAAGDKNDPVDKAILNWLHAYATIAVPGLNKGRKDPFSLKTSSADKVEVRYLTSIGSRAMGLQPSFGLCDGYLVIGSSPETLRRFAKASRGKEGTTSEVPLLRVSFAEVRQYVKDRHKDLAATLAAQQKLTSREVGQQLDNLVAGLGLLDRLELTQRTMTGQVTFTLRVRPTQPLKK